MANIPAKQTSLEQGRETAAKQGSVYSLGYDDQERLRLTTQHNSLIALMGTPPLSPIPSPTSIKTIIDIGCGVNASNSLIFARNFPHAQVYGVDLSPVSIPNCPANLTFIEGNILHLMASDPRLAPGSADLVFSRLLISGMQDWTTHITSVSRLLAPGGWLEMQDIADWNFYVHDDPAPVSKDWNWVSFCMEKLRGPMGLDMLTFDRADEILRDEAGLERCERKVIRLPWGGEGDAGVDEKMRGFMREGRGAWRAALDRMVDLTVGDEGEEKRGEVKGEVERTLRPREGMWFPFVVVWGRRRAE
ncbi:unnamed protein product [Zymoseptoria tritici ST99CH_1A5]|uniref:Methyltransferase type 11 domain-containing protein n=1 Tax=Zymoseptoria tritici ST99CH_1A5 TaxID=1276529 RepID=A0A1Y6LN11_ZYMTR|nr:unnamed protein product [Zymoseptoria tritici ST99CH_1A5]